MRFVPGIIKKNEIQEIHPSTALYKIHEGRSWMAAPRTVEPCRCFVFWIAVARARFFFIFRFVLFSLLRAKQRWARDPDDSDVPDGRSAVFICSSVR